MSNKINDKFINALINWKKDNWKKKTDKELAEHIGVSPQHLSNFITKKRECGEETIVQICKKLGIDYREFIDADQPGHPAPAKVIQFNGNGHLSPEQLKRATMHQCLDTILESGNNVLIAAIESNLVAFKEHVDSKKVIETLEKRIKQLEAAR